MSDPEKHVNHWDVRTERRFHPYYFLGNSQRFDTEPSPPVSVVISVEFDNNDAAIAFETTVREMLEQA